MSVLMLIIRSLALTAWTVWLGGFTFYSAVVLWVVQEEHGTLDAGYITQRVTLSLNTIGVATLAIWWLVALVEWRARPRFALWLRLLVLATSSGVLYYLHGQHKVLDDRLEKYGLLGFYPYHRDYLIASTVQWGVNLLLIPTALALWVRPGASGRPIGKPVVAATAPEPVTEAPGAGSP